MLNFIDTAVFTKTEDMMSWSAYVCDEFAEDGVSTLTVTYNYYQGGDWCLWTPKGIRWYTSKEQAFEAAERYVLGNPVLSEEEVKAARSELAAK